MICYMYILFNHDSSGVGWVFTAISATRGRKEIGSEDDNPNVRMRMMLFNSVAISIIELTTGSKLRERIITFLWATVFNCIYYAQLNLVHVTCISTRKSSCLCASVRKMVASMTEARTQFSQAYLHIYTIMELYLQEIWKPNHWDDYDDGVTLSRNAYFCVCFRF